MQHERVCNLWKQSSDWPSVASVTAYLRADPRGHQKHHVERSCIFGEPTIEVEKRLHRRSASRGLATDDADLTAIRGRGGFGYDKADGSQIIRNVLFAFPAEIA